MDAKAPLLRYLGASRQALVWKLDGLSEREARLPGTPTGTSLLGLVKHCLVVEYHYFGPCLGRDPGFEVPAFGGADDPHADSYATSEESMASLVSLYGRVADYVDATVAELPLDAPARVPWWGPRGETTLGVLLVHVLNEVARHAGHADIVRELLDGATGLSAAHSNMRQPPSGWDAHRHRLTEIAEGFAPADRA